MTKRTRAHGSVLDLHHPHPHPHTRPPVAPSSHAPPWSAWVKGVAFGIDRALTQAPDDNAMLHQEILRVCRMGLRTILVSSLLATDIHPRWRSVFDAVCTESGGVVDIAPTGPVVVASPLSRTLDRRLRAEGVACERGAVVLQCQAADEGIVDRAVHALGLPASVRHVDGRVIVVPDHLDTGTGLAAAAERLGLSTHNIIAVGTTSADLPLLRLAERSITTGSAPAALRRTADVVLGDGPGEGRLVDAVCGLGDGAASRVERPGMFLGRNEAGHAVHLPDADRVLVAGASRVANAHVVDDFLARLISSRYSSLVLVGLRGRDFLKDTPGVHVISARTGIHAAHVTAAFAAGPDTVVLDVSDAAPGQRHAILQDALALMRGLRDQYGYPHWFVIDDLTQVDPFGYLQSWPSSGASTCIGTSEPSRVPAALATTQDVTLTPEPHPLDARRISVWMSDGRSRVERFVIRRDEVAVTGRPATLSGVPTSPSRFAGPPRTDLLALLGELEGISPEDLGRVLTAHELSLWALTALNDPECAAELHDIERAAIAALSETLHTARARAMETLGARLRSQTRPALPSA